MQYSRIYFVAGFQVVLEFTGNFIKSIKYWSYVNGESEGSYLTVRI